MFAWNNNYVVKIRHLWHKRTNNRFHLSAKSVALYGVAVLATYGKPHFCLLMFACAVQHNKKFVAHTLRMFENVVVLKLFFKPVFRLHSPVVPLPLSGKFVTALVSSSCNNTSSAGSFHSCSKTVYFASLSLFWLVSSFHFLSPYF